MTTTVWLEVEHSDKLPILNAFGVRSVLAMASYTVCT